MRSQTTRLVAIYLGLAGLVAVVFLQTGHFNFVNYDDGSYVFENANIRAGLTWRGVIWAFTHVHSQNWHPLTTISHMLDCQLFGLKAGGHHFVNVIWHSAAAVLLFLALARMSPSRTGIWPSAFAAALFAIHPLRVESVAWIAERKDVLSGFFFMLTLLAYFYWTKKRTLARYVTMSILFALGLMSKPMLVTLPIVLLLLDYGPLNRGRRSEVTSQKRETILSLIAEKI